MKARDSRTALLLGEEGVEKLKRAKVAVFGIGGVGSFCAEALARGGVGALTFVDKDAVEESNLNRQLVALTSTIGQDKAEVMKARVKDIAPDCEAEAKSVFYLPETAEEFDLSSYDFIADCIDNVTAKICLIERARKANVPVISAMGAGNKLHPELLKIAPVEQTSVCPLARVMRKELAKRGVKGVLCVYSTEEPVQKSVEVGSCSFVPSIMGLMMAGEIVRRLAE